MNTALDVYNTHLYRTLPNTLQCDNDYSQAKKPIFRRKKYAIQYQHIEINHPEYINHIVIDIDYPICKSKDGFLYDFIWDVKDFPRPTFAMLNKHTLTGHLIFSLTSTVLKNIPNQYEYYCDVKKIIEKAFDADSCFTGRICKNPFSDSWLTEYHDVQYELADLKESFTPISPLKTIKGEPCDKCDGTYVKKSGRYGHFWGCDHYPACNATKSFGPNVISLWQRKDERTETEYASRGRNCKVFDTVRHVAYRTVNKFSSIEDFRNFIKGTCEEKNEDGLPYNEVKDIANSITRYTWRKRDSFSDVVRFNRVSSLEELKQRQSDAAKRTNETRKIKTENKINTTIQQIIKSCQNLQSVTQKLFSELSGLSRRTIATFWQKIVAGLRGAEECATRSENQGLDPAPSVPLVCPSADVPHSTDRFSESFSYPVSAGSELWDMVVGNSILSYPSTIAVASHQLPAMPCSSTYSKLLPPPDGLPVRLAPNPSSDDENSANGDFGSEFLPTELETGNQEDSKKSSTSAPVKQSIPDDS